MYLYGLNTELIDGSSKLDFQIFTIIRQFFVRVLLMRSGTAARLPRSETEMLISFAACVYPGISIATCLPLFWLPETVSLYMRY